MDQTPTKPVARARILYVEDDPGLRELITDLLTGEGHQIETAEDGQDGLDHLLAVNAKYDLLLTDIRMPRMNGIELTKRVRADARLSGIPIVIVSYKDREEDRLAGLEAGADRYLTKSSFTDDTLVRVVGELLAGAGG